MQETPETLLEDTSDLLDALMPIMQRSIEALQHTPNPLAQHLVEQEIVRQQHLLKKTEEIRERLKDFWDSQEVDPVEIELEEDNLQETKPKVVGPKENISVEYPDIPGKNITAGGHRIAPITVRIPNGDEIRCRYGSDTFVKVIEEIGIERVKALDIKCNGIRIVATNDLDRMKRKRSGKYYILVGIFAEEKIEKLNEIADHLNINMKARLDRSPYY